MKLFKWKYLNINQTFNVPFIFENEKSEIGTTYVILV